MRIRTRTALAALPLALAAALAGCSSDGTGPGTASAATKGPGEPGGESGGTGGPDGGPASSTPSLSPQEAALRFVRCMRENGVAMDDPVDGRLTVRQRKGADESALRKAMDACRRLQPQKADPSPDPRPSAQG